jgi:arylformamidase
MNDTSTMRLTLQCGGRAFTVRMDRARHIAIPLRFDGAQPNAYGVEPATSHAFEAGGVVGDTRRGGSCNFETATFTPHCNGTHTECVGHIAHQRIDVHTMLRSSLIPATLVSVAPEPALSSSESYGLIKEDDDRIITASALAARLRDADPDLLDALIIRTLPNDVSKCDRRYDVDPAPFFSIEAMHLLVGIGVRHLLVDIPSLDRASDEGRLSAHRVFWNVEAATHDIDPARASTRTVTELIFAPDDIPDGRYLLNLQIAAFVSDAAPSRPILYPVEPSITAA